MTNHWADIDNTSLVFVIGANPSENHPACMAHINAARYGAKAAKLIVVDPRKTRTAVVADLYVRIRPGTDIAFVNGLLNYIITGVVNGNGNVPATFAHNFVAWHNGTTGVSPLDGTTPQATNATSFGRAFVDDLGTTTTALNATALTGSTYQVGADTPYATPFSAALGWPKYCDTRALVSTVGGVSDYKRVKLTTPAGKSYSNMPEFVASILTAGTVFKALQAHVANYTLAETADICGCTEGDIISVAAELVANSRMMSTDLGLGLATPQTSTYMATTILYAMGQTQHTNGSQNIRDLAVLQTIMGNMGRPGGGINALRGIHNVQGSTDMANLYDGIPGYSGNPGASYVSYANPLFGNRLTGTGTTVDTPYTVGSLGLQQRGFYNMTTQWFGATAAAARSNADFEVLYGLWPKGNGVDHVTAFRAMASDYSTVNPKRSDNIKALVCWGQNPAVSEPNQSAVRRGLYDLDLLVVTDLFETETAACKRTANGITYLLPACSHVEEAGSVTNSGRWIQWRDRARAPHGNSKADMELLLRLSKALATAGAFDRIATAWAVMPDVKITGNVWDVLYGKYCVGTNFTWDGVSDVTGNKFELLEMTEADRADLAGTVYGSEVVAENVFKEIARPLNDSTALYGGGGTVWIYSGNANACGWEPTKTTAASIGAQPPAYTTVNRAKSRNSDFAGTALTYPRYGWSWLLNRRVFYNNSEVDSDVADVFVAPGLMSRVMTFKSTNTNTLADWSLVYRAYNTLKDTPSIAGGPHAAGLPGNFPAHTEPIETPRRDLAVKYGRNLSVAAASVKSDTPVAMWSTLEPYNPITADAKYPGTGSWAVDAKDFPFVLTTIRCVEHFQGGPITRNNSWNVEAEPVPWIEINSIDASAKGIADGDWVEVTTARSAGRAAQEDLTRTSAAGFARGFKARVGVGLKSNQRVAPGVVAIPWHWGDVGLSTGSRANDLCIDAVDANTSIPEYKACLCQIAKI